MTGEWEERWANGRTGWHEAGGNAGLRAYWPKLNAPASGVNRVLVPLCGKSPDLLWLAARGHQVVGVELAEIPVRELFTENNLEYVLERSGNLDRYTAKDRALTVYCGDYFQFSDIAFDALYDRGALVALPQSLRSAYMQHTRQLLTPDAVKLIITLEYDQTVVQGPPFAVGAEEILAEWNGLRRVAVTDDLENCPPKFRAAGLREIQEVVWLAS